MTGSTPQSTIRNPQSQDGVLIIDKPAGWTSHDVVARVRKIMKTRRVGHTGTLDPFATGVLVVCLNRATRLVRFLTGDDKEYLATMRLGFATNTGDLTGNQIAPVTDASHITADDVESALVSFRGRIKQVPPMYSAKKVGGVKLYEMARRGEEVERAPVEVEIKELELIDAGDARSMGDAPTLVKDFSLRVVSSAGTYVRTLAEEIGQRLGVGAHLTQLRRTRAGDCRIGAAISLERLAQLAEGGQAEQAVVSMWDALAMPALEIAEAERKHILHGRSIRRPGRHWSAGSNGMWAKLGDEKNQLIAIARYDESKDLWFPVVVLAD